MEPTTVAPLPTEPPAPEPSPTAPGLCTCRILREQGVPQSLIAAAVANPERVDGWRRLLDPNKPMGPFNPPRECLSLRNPELWYNPVANPLAFRVGCP